MGPRRHKMDIDGAEGKSQPIEVDQSSDMVTIPITMSRSNWCELWNSVASKRTQIENGDYGEGEDPSDNEKWIADLMEIERILSEALDAKGVSY